MSLLSLLFPEHCFCCGNSHATPLCNACVSCLPRKKKRVCPRCQKHTTENGATCAACYGKISLDGVFSAIPYDHPTVSRIISAYKYAFAQPLHIPLAKVLTLEITLNHLPLPDLLVPVPLHARRLRWRGFNQSALLAEKIAHDLLPGTPLRTLNALLRARNTSPQAKVVSKKIRLGHLKDAFTLNRDISPETLRDTRVWLIDDVATTNTTLSECARVLKKHGVKEVWGIVVAN